MVVNEQDEMSMLRNARIVNRYKKKASGIFFVHPKILRLENNLFFSYYRNRLHQIPIALLLKGVQ